MNAWSFTGNLGSDCEVRQVGSDSVVQFSVAVKSGFGDKESTTWVRCNIWGKRGTSVAPYLMKGQLVGVVGEATLREFTNKDGAKQTSLDVRVDNVTLLGKRDSQSSPSTKETPAARPAAPNEDPEDDIPFN